MSILTYKVKHKIDFKDLFDKAYQVALYAQSKQEMKIPTTKDVKHFGLKSEISNQILRKYYSNKKLKIIKKDKVKLTIPSRNLKVNKLNKSIYIPCLKTTLNYWFDFNFDKINQIEFDKEYAYISLTLKDKTLEKEPAKWIGIDLNSTSHSIVMANQRTGNVKKYGKQIPFLKKIYKNLRKKNQSKGAYKLITKQSKRETNKTKDLLHKMTTAIVKEAKETNCGIRIENLKGIRKNTKKFHKEQNHTLNSWPFYMFRTLLTYKSLLLGVKLEVISPEYTSQTCSKCNKLGNRDRKLFKCPQCGHLEHSDVNAAFNIASRLSSNLNKNEIIKTEEKTSPLDLSLALRESNSLESRETFELLSL
jgi:putative transposase